MLRYLTISSNSWRIGWIFWGVFLWGCSRHPLSVAESVSGRVPAAADSLRVKLSLTSIKPDGEEEEFSAVLWAVPAKRYRMEISGPLGMSVASLLWNANGWLLNLNAQEKHIRGFGHIVSVRGVPLPDLSVHELFAPAWGQMLPDGFAEAVARDSAGARLLDWTDRNGRHVRAEVDPENPSIPRRVTIGDLSVEYGDPAWKDSLIVPGRVEFFRGGERFFTVRIKEVRRRVPWSSAIWSLKPLGSPVQP